VPDLTPHFTQLEEVEILLWILNWKQEGGRERKMYKSACSLKVVLSHDKTDQNITPLRGTLALAKLIVG